MPSEQWAGYLCGIVLSPCSTLRDLAVQSVVAYHRFALTNLYVGRTRMCFPQEVVPSSICWFFWEQCPPIYPITPSAIRASTGKPADCWLASSRGYCVEFWNNYAVDGSCDSSRAAAAMIFLFLAPQKKSGHTCNSIWAEIGWDNFGWLKKVLSAFRVGGSKIQEFTWQNQASVLYII